MSRKERIRYYAIYSIIFMIMFFLISITFIRNGKTFVSTNDGFTQHYRALMYYGVWLRSIIKSLLFDHHLVIPEWDFSIGMGAGTITNFHYYGIGDPFAFLSVFVPGKYTEYLYTFIVMLRIYFSGITFSCFAIYREVHLKQKTAPVSIVKILAGALLYCLSAYPILGGLRHPFFINGMLYLPLIILGCEKILEGKAPYTLIFSVALTALSNFYFFYMAVIITVVYVLTVTFVRYFKRSSGGIKRIFRNILQIGSASFTGVLIASFLFLPVVLFFLSDTRSDIMYDTSLFYDLSYYRILIHGFFTSLDLKSVIYLGYGCVAFAAVYFLYFGKNRRQYKTELKILFIIGTLLLLFPYGARFMNGMSYPTNRWVWGYGLFIALILMDVWDSFLEPRKIDLIVFLTGILLYTIFYHNERSFITVLISMLLLWILLLYAYLRKTKQAAKLLSVSVLMILCFGLCTSGIRLNDEDRIGFFLDPAKLHERMADNPNKRILKISKDEPTFFRYAGTGIQNNSSINDRTHVPQFYWSLSNANIAEFFDMFGVRIRRPYIYSGLDDRTMFSDMIACRNFVNANKDEIVPYGYQFIGKKDGYYLYKNELSLPFVSVYHNWMSVEDLKDHYIQQQREEAAFQSVVLDNGPDELHFCPPVSGIREEMKVCEKDDSISQEGLTFTVSKRKSKFVVAPEGTQTGEQYLYITGFDYEGDAPEFFISMTGQFTDGSQVSKSIFFDSKKAERPYNPKNCMVNFGYHDVPLETVTITLPKTGTYYFDDISFWKQPLDQVQHLIKEKQSETLENEKIETNRISGNITCNAPGFLFLSIPYDGGWTAYVDGVKTPVKQANIGFSAVEISEGEHAVELIYHTPGLRAGLCMTLVGLLLVLFHFCLSKRKKCKQE